MRLMESPPEHATVKQIFELHTNTELKNYFKFAFVRNPWDWQISFYHYVISKRLHPQHRIIRSLGSFENYLNWRLQSGVQLQKDFLVDESGHLIVDFIGRFENLENDFKAACQKIGIEESLPHSNTSRHADYRTYYTDKTIELVREAYKEDIELFGYNFDPEH